VPRSHVEGPVNLGIWVGNQRNRRETLSAARRRRLDTIGFIWGVHESAWKEGFLALKQFKARNAGTV
jgi:hypothetical protein